MTLRWRFEHRAATRDTCGSLTPAAAEFQHDMNVDSRLDHMPWVDAMKSPDACPMEASASNAGT
jgi:hypothetical protein